VIAVDMKNIVDGGMERVAKYTLQTEGGMNFANMLTTISKYLAPPGDSEANIRKRKQGPASLGGSPQEGTCLYFEVSGLVKMEEEEDNDH
jgi:hypothetical protein